MQARDHAVNVGQRIPVRVETPVETPVVAEERDPEALVACQRYQGIELEHPRAEQVEGELGPGDVLAELDLAFAKARYSFELKASPAEISTEHWPLADRQSSGKRSPLQRSDHPLNLIKVWQGGLVFYGGFIGATLASVYYCQRKGISFFRIADIMIPSLAIGHFFGRLGCFSAGCCHGVPTGSDLYGAVFSAPGTVVARNVPDSASP